MKKKYKFDITLHPEFKEIPGFEGLYSIDENGNLYSHRKKKLMKPDIKKRGILSVLNLLQGQGMPITNGACRNKPMKFIYLDSRINMVKLYVYKEVPS